MSKQSPVLNRKETVELTGLSLCSVDKAIRSGELQTVKVGKRNMILREPLEAALQKHQAESKKPKPKLDPESALFARLQRRRAR